jgi:hypothetical protein
MSERMGANPNIMIQLNTKPASTCNGKSNTKVTVPDDNFRNKITAQ